ncbi:carboxypeptidase M32 [Neobacillus sp. D3-1R]|uniref:carboxypeptidase M32 n=1 Tax=Neobacillus sp. D3-1R TaxID=3445778 RepID=UPI003FA0F105
MITTKNSLQLFKELDEKITHLSTVSALVGWDQKVMAPKKGRMLFSKAASALETEIFKLMVSEDMGNLLNELSSPEMMNSLDEVTRARVRERKQFYDRSKAIPTELYQEYSTLTNEANHIWEEARANNDFGHYLPYLERIVEMKRKFAEIVGYKGHPYNALLDEFEQGLTVEALDPLFAELRKVSVELLKRIQDSPYKTPEEIFDQKFSTEKQKEFNRYVLPIIGFDMEAGRLDETVHPFAQSMNTGDVRITTRYLENNVRSALFGTIHEAGHGMYEQNIDPEYEGTVLRNGTSFGIHESQSRFFENMVGRSKEFWNFFFPTLQSYFPEQLKDITVDEFYRAINTVKPSLIRVEADELTYNLHIMIRYEIEKGLISGELQVKDLPSIWNKKMEEYIGTVPNNDSEGVLQDVHWSFGGLGYFPSYTLGNLYAAQILNTIQQEIPHFYQTIENGQFEIVNEWLRTKIHQYGSFLSPNELIVKVTGEELNAKYLAEYLTAKYSQIYGL